MRHHKKFILALGAATLAMGAGSAKAQAPGSFNPGVQLQQQLREAVPQQGPSYTPAPTSGDGAPVDTQQPSGQPSQTIFLKGVRLRGNTLFTEKQLVAPFLPLVGQEVSFAQVLTAAQSAESLYKRAGYITTRVVVTPQDFNSGYVYIDVVEGFIQSLDVKGGSSALQAYAKKMLQPVYGAGKKNIFNYNKLEKQLLLVRNFGATQYNVVISRGTEKGGSVLTVELNPKVVTGGVVLDNNLPTQLGDWQVGANASYFTPTSQPFKVTAGGNYSLPYFGNSKYGGLINGYGLVSTPIGNKGFKADALWAISSTNSVDLWPDGPANLQTKGESNYWSFGIGYPLILERNSQLSIALKGTGQNSSNDLYLDGTEVTDLSTDKIRAVRLSLDGYYAAPTFTSSASFQVSQGIGGLSDDLAADEFLSNPFGDPNFTTARLNLNHLQKVFDTGVQLNIRGAGQLSRTALPVPEEFTYGGPTYGRAFKSVYILGDQGYAAGAEIAYPVNFKLWPSSGDMTVSPFVWYDYGYTSYKEGPLPNNSASTYGVGLRGSGLYNTTFEVGWGMPATNTLQPEKIGIDESIVYFNAGWKF